MKNASEESSFECTFKQNNTDKLKVVCYENLHCFDIQCELNNQQTEQVCSK